MPDPAHTAEYPAPEPPPSPRGLPHLIMRGMKCCQIDGCPSPDNEGYEVLPDRWLPLVQVHHYDLGSRKGRRGVLVILVVLLGQYAWHSKACDGTAKHVMAQLSM